MGQHNERYFDSVAQMASALAAELAELLNDAVAQRGTASMVVSGGRFSAHLFRALGEQSVPWDRVVVTLADERWVPANDKQSNEKLVRETLIADTAAQFVPMWVSAEDTAVAADEIEKRLVALRFPVDVTLLGMGDDGHTASLFPSAPAAELDFALTAPHGGRVAFLHPSVSPVPRVSMTLPTLLDTHRIYLHIPGAAKLSTYQKACDTGPVSEMPVRGVLRQERVPVDILLCPSEEP